MEILGIKETDLRHNKPVELFTANGRLVAVKIANIVDCAEWLGLATDVENAEVAMKTAMVSGDMQKAKEQRTEFYRALCVAVESYPGLTQEDRDAIKAASWAQVMGAFWRLKTLSDPFDFSQAMTEATTAERLAKLPKAAVEAAISDMRSQRALSQSGNGTT